MATKKPTQAELVQTDAKNRALRSFLQGLGIDVLVAVAITLASIFATAGGWGDLQWVIVSFSFAKSILQAVASYIMRRFLDSTKVVPDKVAPPAESGE